MAHFGDARVLIVLNDGKAREIQIGYSAFVGCSSLREITIPSFYINYQKSLMPIYEILQKKNIQISCKIKNLKIRSLKIFVIRYTLTY